MLAAIVVGLTAFALLAARLVGVDPTFLWPLGEQGHEDFWRRVLPWPRGVQEDDEIAWHVPRSGPVERRRGSPSAPGREARPADRAAASDRWPLKRGGMVGAAGFEPTTLSSRTIRATKLRHAPTGCPLRARA